MCSPSEHDPATSDTEPPKANRNPNSSLYNSANVTLILTNFLLEYVDLWHNSQRHMYILSDKAFALTSLALQTFTVLSWDEVYKRPSPPHFTQVTECVWPVRILSHRPSTVSHIRTDASLDELAKYRHSGFLFFAEGQSACSKMQ